MRRFPALIVVALLAAAAPAADKVRKPNPAKPRPPAKGTWYVDDEAVFANLMDKLEGLAKAGKTLPRDTLKGKIKEGKAAVVLAKPGDKPLLPEEVYKAARPGVLVVGSVVKDADGEWTDGRYATAWAATADGVLVTNWHVFEELAADESFGAADSKGNVYPVTDFLGGNKAADVAVFKVAAAGLTPLPVAGGPAEVGSWVGVLSHPGDQFFMFTQGHVSRYSRATADDGTVERWMNVTADYATGSSGGPVLDRFGAVVGMAAMTVNVDYADEEPKADPPAGGKGPPPAEKGKPGPAPAPADAGKAAPGVPAGDGKESPKGPAADGPPAERPDTRPEPRPSTLQMVVKLTVPVSLIRRTAGGGPGAEADDPPKEPAKK